MELLRFPMLRVCVLCRCINLAHARAAQRERERENNGSAGRAVVAPWLLLPLCCSCNTAARMQLMPQTPHAWPALRDEVAVSLLLVPAPKLAHFTLVSVESSAKWNTRQRPPKRATHCSQVNPCRLAPRRLINQ